MRQRQQSSTSYPITFLVVDETDHLTGKTGLTPTVTISKNGAAFGAPSGLVSEIGEGWYALAGNATDRDTLGDLLIHAEAAGADPVDDRYCIVPWNPFDANALGLAYISGDAYARLGAPAGGVSISADVAALNDITVADIIAGISDGTLDLQEMLRIILAAVGGKSAGGGTGTITFRDSADSKNRISATVDASGNRTAITLDGS